MSDSCYLPSLLATPDITCFVTLNRRSDRLRALESADHDPVDFARLSRGPGLGRDLGQAQGDGVQGQADAGSDHGAVDADVLQIVPQQQLQLA